MKRKPNKKVIYKAIRFLICKEAYYMAKEGSFKSQAVFDTVLWETFNKFRIEIKEKWENKKREIICPR